MADLRGFVYALEPLKLIGEWNEERLQLELAGVQRKRLMTVAKLDKIVAEADEVSGEIKMQIVSHLDPQRYQQVLDYLLYLSSKKKEVEIRLAAVEREVSELIVRLRNQQKKTEGFRTHAATEKKEFLLEQSRLQSAIEDQDWLARLSWRNSNRKMNNE